MGLRYARRYGVPLVYTYHTQLEEYAHYVPFEPNATRFAAAQLTRTFANLADAVVVPTRAMAQRLREVGVRARIEIVPSGIDVARFGAGRRNEPLRARLGARARRAPLLCVGRLAKEKNVEAAARGASPARAIPRCGSLSPERARCAPSWSGSRGPIGMSERNPFSRSSPARRPARSLRQRRRVRHAEHD